MLFISCSGVCMYVCMCVCVCVCVCVCGGGGGGGGVRGLTLMVKSNEINGVTCFGNCVNRNEFCVDNYKNVILRNIYFQSTTKTMDNQSEPSIKIIPFLSFTGYYFFVSCHAMTFPLGWISIILDNIRNTAFLYAIRWNTRVVIMTIRWHWW